MGALKAPPGTTPATSPHHENTMIKPNKKLVNHGINHTVEHRRLATILAPSSVSQYTEHSTHRRKQREHRNVAGDRRGAGTSKGMKTR